MNYLNDKKYLPRRKIQRNIFSMILFLSILLFSGNLHAQSNVSMNAGFNQSIFYCGQAKSDYYYSFTPYNSYAVSFFYKENLTVLQKNLQIGAQIEFKQQSAWFYYEDVYPADTFATGMRYDIRSVNLYLFPELKVGGTIRFIFGGGPILQYIVNVKAKGTQLQMKAGQSSIETEINDKNSKEITGFSFGAKINLGVEIPLHKNLYLTFYNNYTFGFTGMQGNRRKQMKYFNCLDIGLLGGVLYQIEHKNWFANRKK
ncbi:MAG: hypothetical protein LBG80_08465 [Bacteroidales bacterium]|jgi:hypothetical protein|nr:hypothetical protein [Bacteroidales bacterium]